MIRFFYRLITFIFALFFLMLGLMSILIQTSHHIRSEVITFILENTWFFSLFGVTFFLIGIALIVYLLAGFKKHYYKIKSKNNVAYLDESLFQDYIKNYWKQLFPKHEIPFHLVLKKNKALITADFPYVPDSQQKALLERIDRDLKDIFIQLLGYYQEYVVSISFQSKAPERPLA